MPNKDHQMPWIALAGITALACVVGLLSIIIVACAHESDSSQQGVNLGCIGQDGDQSRFHRPHRLVQQTEAKPLDPEHFITLRVHLALRNEAQLDAFLDRTAKVGGPDAGLRMTPELFRQTHLPTPEHLDAVDAYLRSHGIETSDRVGTVVHAQGRAKHMEQAFGSPLHAWKVDGKVLHAPSSGMAIPESLHIVAVRGLATQAHYTSRLKPDPAVSGHEPLRPKDIRDGYNIPKEATGRGTVLALVELDGYKPSDIAGYCRDANLREIPRRDILVAGAGQGPVTPDGQTECTMDIQLVHALAPDAQELQIAIAPQKNAHGFLDIINRLANPAKQVPLAAHIGCSWGAPESHMSHAAVVAESKIYKQMRAQGQTMYAASGDSGARDDGVLLGTDDPASQPDVLGVGGTRLTIDPARQWKQESTWKGGGGGMSCYWHAPPWQKDLLLAASRASDRWRNVPDVALHADPEVGYRVMVNGQWLRVGGTSCAAPLWAAFGALVEQRRLELHRSRLGFLPPYLYALGKSDMGQVVFHDIADGSTNGYYPAVPGLDDATGWGSFNGALLLKALEDAEPK